MISVIIPVYNVENYLHVCLNSILKQTYRDFEVICIDDASNDSSLEILEYFHEKDSRIKILKNDSNRGQGFSRNRGLDVAQGKYVFFLDSDDWLSVNTFEILIKTSEKYNLDLLLFKNIVYYEESHEFGMEEYYDMKFMEKFEREVFNQWDLDKTKLFDVPIGPCNKLYLKSFLDDYNIRFTDKNYIQEDNPFSCKAWINADRISFINKYFYNRRRRPDSIMTLNNERLFDGIPISYMILDVFLENKEIYEYYKCEVLTYIFKALLIKYNKIEDQYKDEFYNAIQGVYSDFIEKYDLYDDIEKSLDNAILDFLNENDVLFE
ncbi:MAG: glycosyltransferase family 2 protein [Methanobrevibacter sp.]|uniref:glycosyltransferase family 2 protein n=1 Tax=Methanobrevibacter sp. TaxID=66852 RepID=UPI0025FBD673|nr:glycosyltransferase family 2 protein [Methanobrevibacter sp.]MBQ6099341.1 glycosyltransferase family 2 protein [Methanobrevibacter sp.]